MRTLIRQLSRCTACVLLWLTQGQVQAQPPNIILILADDLGYSDLGCYGGEISTPNIDALAASGVRLTQLYNSARCCPSRASLMTGLYPTQAGIGDFTTGKPHPTRGKGYLGRLRDDCVTIAEVLKPAGYGCFYVGKWHLHDETGPIQRGFDEFYGYTFDHSHDQYDADYYLRLPKERSKEIDPSPDEYYATDVFNALCHRVHQAGPAIEQAVVSFPGAFFAPLPLAGTCRTCGQVRQRHIYADGTPSAKNVLNVCNDSVWWTEHIGV